MYFPNGWKMRQNANQFWEGFFFFFLMPQFWSYIHFLDLIVEFGPMIHKWYVLLLIIPSAVLPHLFWVVNTEYFVIPQRQAQRQAFPSYAICDTTDSIPHWPKRFGSKFLLNSSWSQDFLPWDFVIPPIEVLYAGRSQWVHNRTLISFLVQVRMSSILSTLRPLSSLYIQNLTVFPIPSFSNSCPTEESQLSQAMHIVLNPERCNQCQCHARVCVCGKTKQSEATHAGRYIRSHSCPQPHSKLSTKPGTVYRYVTRCPILHNYSPAIKFTKLDVQEEIYLSGLISLQILFFCIISFFSSKAAPVPLI